MCGERKDGRNGCDEANDHHAACDLMQQAGAETQAKQHHEQRLQSERRRRGDHAGLNDALDGRRYAR